MCVFLTQTDHVFLSLYTSVFSVNRTSASLVVNSRLYMCPTMKVDHIREKAKKKTWESVFRAGMQGIISHNP